jgi:DNA-binding beta-propeller fold protein YncE
MGRAWIRGLLLSPVLVLLLVTNLYAQTSFVYTNDEVQGPNTVSGFAVAGDGALTPLPGSPFSTGGMGAGSGFVAVNRITICSTAKLLYASNARSNDVSGFSLDPSTGSLVLVPGSPFSTGGVSTGGISLACTPNGRFLMAASTGSSDITVFSIGGNGALTPIAASPFSVGSTPDGIKISPDGRFLAVALVNINAMAMFGIAADGTLTPIPGSPFAGASAEALAGVDINLFRAGALRGQLRQCDDDHRRLQHRSNRSAEPTLGLAVHSGCRGELERRAAQLE